MAQKNSIQFSIDFKTGDTKALQELKNDLAEIQQMASQNVWGSPAEDLNKITTAAHALESALNQAFDPDLNTVNIQKFNQVLRQSGMNAETLYKDLSMAGTEGQQAFLKMSGQLMQFNTAIKQSNEFLNGLATTFFNTVKWSVMSSIVNNISGTIQKSFYYIKDLNTGLNDIRIVTGKSADEMERFAVTANDAAKALSVSTEDFTKGALIYYQQGLDDETSTQLAEITAKTANVTGQSMSAVSEELTAVWNGYQVANQAAEEGMQVYEEYVDKMAAVGATTASDLEELSTAMSKVASAASAMGVNFDDLNAQIATIVSVTRQAPESVGTALKTIYARLGDLKIDGVDEFGVKLGEVSQQLQDIGINVLDQEGNLRDMSDVIAEVADHWNTWTDAQRQAAAVAMAGKRQYNNLIALFDNWEMHEEALATSIGAVGTLNEQQAIAAESLAKKMEKMSATAEDLYGNLFDEDSLIGLVEAGTNALQLLADFTESVGGLKNLLPMLGSLGLQVFNEQIGKGLANIVINAQTANREIMTMQESQQALQAMFSSSTFVSGAGANTAALKESAQELYSYYQQMAPYQSAMTKEQKEQYNNILNLKVEAGNLSVELEKQAQH
jgi:TP901 family phage tail tape measure protein